MSPPAPLKPAYLICGSDRPKVRTAVSRLRRRVLDETGSDLNLALFDAESDAPRVVLEAAESPGFALGTRLLLVLNGHKWKVKERQSLLPYLADPMPGTCLAIEGETFSKDDALAKTIAKVGDVLRYDLPRKQDLPSWAAKRAGEHRLKLPLSAARHLVAVCGEQPERLEREIEKLAVYCRGGEATAADIDAVCSADDAARIFDLMDAVGLRRRAQAFRLLQTIFASGDPRDDANSVLYNLKRHVGLLDAASQLQHNDPATAAKDLKVHPYTARKLLQQREHYDRRRLSRAYRALAEAEAGMRGRAPASLESSGGVNHGDRLVMELALARLLA